MDRSLSLGCRFNHERNVPVEGGEDSPLQNGQGQQVSKGLLSKHLQEITRWSREIVVRYLRAVKAAPGMATPFRQRIWKPQGDEDGRQTSCPAESRKCDLSCCTLIGSFPSPTLLKPVLLKALAWTALNYLSV